MSRYDLTKEDLAQVLSEEPSYRVDQVARGLAQGLSPLELTTLPRSLRTRLDMDPALRPAFELTRETVADGGSTIKWLLTSTLDGSAVESVLMRYSSRATVCVSSQSGCAMGCAFCATGQMGFGRHLSSGEIVEQVVVAARSVRDRGWGRLSNVVFMGMGEPMANYERVLSAIRSCHEHLGLGQRAFTISTVGVVPGIRKLATEPMQVNLAVSLHAANDMLRSSLVPLNRRYPLVKVMTACSQYAERTNRRISFEWALIAGRNDREVDAAELAALVHPLGRLAHVNLIPLNPTPGFAAVGSSRAVVNRFRDRLLDLGVNTTVRDTRGRSVQGACGQLAADSKVTVGRRLA